MARWQALISSPGSILRGSSKLPPRRPLDEFHIWRCRRGSPPPCPEVDFGELVALAAASDDEGNRQISDLLSAGIALLHQHVEALRELGRSAGFYRNAAGRGSRATASPAMAYTGFLLWIAGIFGGDGMQCREDAAQAGYSRIARYSTRESSRNSAAMRWNGLKLSAKMAVVQRRCPAMAPARRDSDPTQI